MWSLFKYGITESWNALHFDRMFRQLANQFTYKVHYTSHFNASETKDVQYAKIGAKIAQIYNTRYENIAWYLRHFELILPITMVFIALAAIQYHRKYLRRDRFSNYIIGIS